MECTDLNPAARSTHGWTGLHIAAAAGHMDICSTLLSAYPELDVNIRTCSGQTAVHLAAKYGHTATVQVLFHADADLNAVNDKGWTALHYAAYYGHENVVRYLVSHGADARMETNAGRIAAELTEAPAVQKRLGEVWNEYNRTRFCDVLLRNSREDMVQKLIANRPKPMVEQVVKVSYKDFTPVRFLGKGGFGEVYLVKKLDNGQLYALKTMKKSFLAKNNLFRYVLTERNVLTYLEHPFIEQLIWAFQTPTRLILVLEYYPCGSFRYYLNSETRLPESIAQMYAAEVLLAIECLHRKKIMYRDLKPENLVFDYLGHIRLIDFGLAKEDVYEDVTTSSFCGSVSYLAPEMVSHRDYDRTVDWYMFGCFVYEMIVGKAPFQARQPTALVKLIADGNIIFPADISDAALDLIQSLMQTDPKKRLGTKGVGKVKEHPFFKGIDWKRTFERRLPVPIHDADQRHASVMIPQLKLYGDVKKSAEERTISGWAFSKQG